MQTEVREIPRSAVIAAVQLPNVNDVEFEASLAELRDLAKTLANDPDEKTADQLAADEQKRLAAEQNQLRDKNLLNTFASVAERITPIWCFCVRLTADDPPDTV